ISVYVRHNIEERNKIANNTIDFIDSRLRFVEVGLDSIEGTIEGFKVSNSIADIRDQATQLVSRTNTYSDKQIESEVNLRILEDLENYIRNNINNRSAIPFNLLRDESLSFLINQYNQLQTKRDEMSIGNTPDNPYVVSLDKQLDIFK